MLRARLGEIMEMERRRLLILRNRRHTNQAVAANLLQGQEISTAFLFSTTGTATHVHEIIQVEEGEGGSEEDLEDEDSLPPLEGDEDDDSLPPLIGPGEMSDSEVSFVLN
jgi:hypothetical protein